MNIENKNIRIEKPDYFFAPALLQYHNKNKNFLEPYVPKRDDSFYTLEYQEAIIENNIKQWSEKKGYCFYIFDINTNDLIGMINLSNIIRGVFHSCFLGYSLDKDYINKGIMSVVVREIVDFAFEELNLHRIEANVMPKNISSIKVLKNNNFEEEGLAKKYLCINGNWEDHLHFSIINENFY